MSDLLRTPLFELHQQLGAKLVPFAGYEMPVQYSDGVMKEHLHTRAEAGLFDVSHMGQLLVRGEGAALALEKLIPIDIEALGLNKQSYGVLTSDSGGILDDLIVTRWGDDEFFVVVNAGCKADDIAHIRAHMPSTVEVEVLERALIALQGPKAVEIMATLSPEAVALTFMNGCHTKVAGSECYVTRSGYTGEDGFEISVAVADALALTQTLLKHPAVKPIGLGARDSLRLEAGLCLYGHDMDESLSPIEASLLWSISRSRRIDGAKAGGFLGAECIFKHISDGVSRKRVGLKPLGKAPVREGAEIVNAEGVIVGIVTSGGFGPTVAAPVAMGYVSTALAIVGSELSARVRKKLIPIEVVKLPFVEQRYFRG